MFAIKKSINIIIISVLILTSIFLFTACGAGSDSMEITGADNETIEISGGNIESKDMTGTYKLVKLISDGEESAADDIALLESVGLTADLVIEADGTAMLNLFNETMELTWDDEYFYQDGLPIDYSASGDKIILGASSGNDVMEFQYSEE